MKLLVAVGSLALIAGCAATNRVAIGFPSTGTLHSPSVLSGRYYNRGLAHSPDQNRAIEAYLDEALGLPRNAEGHAGGIILQVAENHIVVVGMDGDRVLHETTLTRDRDYRLTDEGVELLRNSEGPGPEGVFSMKVASRLLLCLRDDRSLVLKVHQDIRAVALWPYRDSRDLWYDFEREANYSPEPTPSAVH
jgi:hypothetical protein